MKVGVDRGSRRQSWLAGVLGSVTLALIFSMAFDGPAAADPPLTVADAKAQIEQLETDAAAIDQEYVGVQEELKEGRARLRLKRADLRHQTSRVSQLRDQAGQVALAQFQNHDLDATARLLFAEDTEAFLSQVSTVDKVSENQTGVLQNFQQQQATLANLEHSARTDVAALSDHEQQLTKLRAASDKKVTEAKAVLAKLTAAERAQIAAEEAKATEEAQNEAEQGTDKTSRDGDRQPVEETAGTSGRGAAAMAFARKQLGKPYRFGAAGPGAYDCSGLTLMAWKAAGVTLPRTSQQQYRVGRTVAKADLEPGDLIFFYSDLSHVSLYAGNGMVLDAPRPGKTVRYIKMSYMPYVGAKRPG